jgi:hydrogenase maturation protease
MAAHPDAFHKATIALSESAQTPSTLVLGFGNVLSSDDGAGVRLMERLRDELGVSAAQFVDGGTMSFELLSFVEAAGSLLVVEAANIHRPPAAVAVFEGAAMDQFLRGFRRRTVHEIGLIDLLDCARLLGCLPTRRALICIQPERIDLSTSLSDRVEQALSEAARHAKSLLQRWSGE